MQIAAIIAEYNPFHNGHAWQAQTLRGRGITHIVAVMSPDYVQRGFPAVFDKRTRARAALLGGVDLVVELPLPYAISTAEHFAFGGVSLVNAMNCVDFLAFGSETASLSLLKEAANAVSSAKTMAAARIHLDNGRTFAQARQMAVRELFGENVAAVLGRPNNSLAVEYLRKLCHSESAVKPIAILRTGVEHDSLTESGSFASATLLRSKMESGELDSISDFVPKSALDIYRTAVEGGSGPASMARGERAVLAKLRSLPSKSFLTLPDLSEGIENRLAAAIRSACSLEEIYSAVKTKRYTLARVRRLVLSAFLELQGELCLAPPPYVRVLGFNTRGKEILGAMKKAAPAHLESETIPCSTSLANLQRGRVHAEEFARAEAAAADLYSLFLPKIKPCGLDYTEALVWVGE